MRAAHKIPTEGRERAKRVPTVEKTTANCSIIKKPVLSPKSPDANAPKIAPNEPSEPTQPFSHEVMGP
ncbi:hypothetical protein QA089_004185 [Meyerozyma guilliermondii]